jgi:hypothetical protein
VGYSAAALAKFNTAFLDPESSCAGAIAMAFHFVLSAGPAFAVVDFTAALYALFILFLSERDIESVLSRINWVASRSARQPQSRPPDPDLTGVHSRSTGITCSRSS